MAGRGISTPALALAGAGALVVWSAIEGVSLASGLRTFLSGHVPIPAAVSPVATQIGQEAADLAAGGGSAVSARAMTYLGGGAVYRYGGGNPTRGWDCSGFVNYVIGHDLAQPIPGVGAGKFTGNSHGPATSQWALWSGCQTIPRSQCQAGDIIVWPAFHMGIAVDSTTMINCPGPNGTPAPVLHKIDTGHTGMFLVRRLRESMGAIPPGAAL